MQELTRVVSDTAIASAQFAESLRSFGVWIGVSLPHVTSCQHARALEKLCCTDAPARIDRLRRSALPGATAARRRLESGPIELRMAPARALVRTTGGPPAHKCGSGFGYKTNNRHAFVTHCVPENRFVLRRSLESAPEGAHEEKEDHDVWMQLRRLCRHSVRRRYE
jgi:hypothetical protein